MFQELLISDTALKMAGAFAISLETNIDRKDIEIAVKDFQVWRLIRVVTCISISDLAKRADIGSIPYRVKLQI